MWRRSSRCDSACCVEVAFHSASLDNGTCVEVGACDCNVVQVRDSKDPDGPRLKFSPTAWAAFITGIRAGEFDRR